ncbi:response regulator [Nitrososphaera sp.]|uniref:response regulator n=1 Tax=Nitrososphaera sp. TaxID=1971748 RepID=UPI002ED9E0DF
MNVLIADDDILIIKLYRVALESRGHTVTSTYNGRECVDVFKQELARVGPDADPFDVVVMDHRMPKMDGVKAAGVIIELRPNQRIIFITACARETLKASVQEIGQVVSILEKPFEPILLAKVIEDIFTFKDLAEINKLLKVMYHNTCSEVQITQLHSLLKTIQKIGLS